MHKSFKGRKFRSFDEIATISARSIRSLRRSVGMCFLCKSRAGWRTGQASASCRLLTWLNLINTLIFSRFIFSCPLTNIAFNTTRNRDIFPWGCSPYQLWLDKLGRVANRDIKYCCTETWRTSWSFLLEEELKTSIKDTDWKYTVIACKKIWISQSLYNIYIILCLY